MKQLQNLHNNSPVYTYILLKLHSWLEKSDKSWINSRFIFPDTIFTLCHQGTTDANYLFNPSRVLLCGENMLCNTLRS